MYNRKLVILFSDGYIIINDNGKHHYGGDTAYKFCQLFGQLPTDEFVKTLTQSPYNLKLTTTISDDFIELLDNLFNTKIDENKNQ